MQPLFAVLADSPEFFVARGNTRGDILVLAFGAMFVPPTLLALLELPFVRMPTARRVVHLVFVGLLVSALVLRILVDVAADGPGGLLVVVALGSGAVAAWLYGRSSPASSFLSALAPAPLVFLFLFLVTSPVSKLVFEKDDSTQAAAPVSGDTPIVMVVFDEFSGMSLMDAQGRVNAQRFPNFAALGRHSTWYRNAVTAADHTTTSVPALLSGTAPRLEALPIASEYPGSLFTLLEGHYSFANVDEPSTNLCPRQVCIERLGANMPRRLYRLSDDLVVVSLHGLLPDDLDDGLPPVDRTFGGFRNQARDESQDSATDGGDEDEIPPEAFENRAVRFAHFVRGIRPSERPGLHFLHVQLPHTAWQYLPSGQQYPVGGPEIPGLDGGGNWRGDPSLVLQASQRYLLQVGYVDRLVGELTERLRAQGMYDDALIVITADHGIGFRPGESRRSVRGAAFPEVANVPLFIKAPHQRRGRVDDGEAGTTDVLPTIADHLDTRLSWTTVGRSLLKARPEDPLTVLSYPSGEATVAFADFVRRRDALLAFSEAVFGTGWADVFRTPGTAALVGADVATKGPLGRSDWQVELDNESLFRSVDPRGTTLPVFVTGRLSGTGPERQLAISVNGRVQALTRSYRDGDDRRFGALLSPRAFRRGDNAVEVLEVRRGGEDVQLARLRRDADFSDARLSEENVETATTAGQKGRRIPIDPNAATDSSPRRGPTATRSCDPGSATSCTQLRAGALVFAHSFQAARHSSF